MNIKEMVEKHLIENKAYGLINDETECSCEIGDLFPCCNPNETECKMAFKKECKKGDCDNCWCDDCHREEDDNGQEIPKKGNYHLTSEKPEEVSK